MPRCRRLLCGMVTRMISTTNNLSRLIFILNIAFPLITVENHELYEYKQLIKQTTPQVKEQSYKLHPMIKNIREKLLRHGFHPLGAAEILTYNYVEDQYS